MTSEDGNSLSKKNKRIAQLEQESNKVQAYVSELKNRLAGLKFEEERIVKISDTLLKKHIGSPFPSKRLTPEDVRKMKDLRKQVWKSEDSSGLLNTQNFQTALKTFQDLQAGLLDPNMNLELFRLRNTNHFLKKRVEDIKLYITKLRDSDPNPEDDACEQLFQASEDALKKINKLDIEINDANTMIANSSRSKTISRQSSFRLTEKTNENLMPKDKESKSSVNTAPKSLNSNNENVEEIL